MSRILTVKNLSSGNLSDNHDGGLDVTGGEVGVDTTIDNELKKKGH